MEEALEFEVSQKEIPVTLKNPKTGDEKKYILRELSGPGRDQYMSDISRRMRYMRDGSPAGMKDFKNLYAYLLSLTLYSVEKGDYLTIKEVQEQIPSSSVQSKLYDKAKEISALGDKAEDEAKND